MTEAIREVIEKHISARAADEVFRARLAVSTERNQRILDRRSKTLLFMAVQYLGLRIEPARLKDAVQVA